MRKILLFCLLLVAGCGVARAGSFSVDPVRIDLSQQDPTVALHVTNDAATDTVVQLELDAWTQQNGKSVLTPTRSLLATPPIFTLPAHGEQVVRVGLLAKPGARLE